MGMLEGSLPVFHIDYEFDVAKNFTLAPFLNVYSFTNDYYWGNKNTPYRYYTYRETVIPIGLKGTYYFDDLLKANSKWDFYLAGSLGFAIVNSTWDAGYGGDRNYYRGGSSLFLDLHIGAEYHFNSRVGAFLDLSSGVSTIGLAIHGTKIITNTMGNLLYLIAVILIIAWAIGFVGYNAGSLIHVLLVIALIAVILRIIQGKSL